MNEPLTNSALPSNPIQKRWLLAIVGIGLSVATWAHWSTLTQIYVVNNDSHQHTFWMHSLEDPERLQDDLLTHYSRSYQPAGYLFLFRSLSAFISPFTAARSLPILLFASSLALLWLVIRSFAGRFEALLCCSVFSVSPFFLQKMAGAHPRAFATPFLLLTLLFLLRRRPWAQGFSLLLQSQVYPMMFLLSSATCLASLVRIENRSMSFEKSWRILIPILLAVGLGCGALALRYEGSEDPRIGSLVSRAEMQASPEFFRGGRARHLPQKGLLGDTQQVIRQGLPNTGELLGMDTSNRMMGWQFRLLLVLLLLAAITDLLHRDFLPSPWIALGISSVLLYRLADLLLLKLFFPKRYIMYSMMLLAVVSVCLLLGRWIRKIPSKPWRRLAQGMVLALAWIHLPAMAGVGLDDYSERAEIFQFAATLPKDAVIAAHPEVAEGIPLFSGRRTLATLEMSLPYYNGFWGTMKERLYCFFDAYYGPDLNLLQVLIDQHDVDYLIVDERTFAQSFFQRPRRGAYFQPFGNYILESVRGQVTGLASEEASEEANGQANFAVLEIPEEKRIFQSTDGQVWAVATADLTDLFVQLPEAQILEMQEKRDLILELPEPNP